MAQNEKPTTRRYQNVTVEDPDYKGENQANNEHDRVTGKAGNFEKKKPEEEMNFDPQLRKKNPEDMQNDSKEKKKTNK